jgi:hypothetical protein
MARAVSRKPLIVLASFAAFGALALVATEVAAAGLNSVHISPSMNHVNTLGGGFGPHTDRVFGPGGGGSQDFAECYRRAHLKLEKADASMGSELISAKARNICGA